MSTNQDETLYETGLRLWNEWTSMWNGEPELALRLVAPRFVLHLVTPTLVKPEEIADPPAVERWVRAHRAKFLRLTFATEVGPFVDVRAGVVAGPWWADTSVEGSVRRACGMDTIAFREGKITEYWTLSKEADDVGQWPRALHVP